MPSILSVGIDIGTSTTQVIFSRITMDNTAGYFSAPRISIVDQAVIYQSAVHFTPLLNETTLDGDGIRALVAEEFRRAGFTPADVDTGAVIITGESARKENAAVVLSKLSDFAGEFVVSTAGPDLESVIAGKGSGAYRYSLQNDCLAANLDIGGGTTNIVLFDGGEVVGKGCYDIGGRLIRFDPDLVVRSVSPAAALIAADVGVKLSPGSRTTEAALRRVTDRMAELLSQSVGLCPAEPLLERLRTPRSTSLRPQKRIRTFFFSGGVADCIAGAPELLRYGDIGPLLGASIRRNPAFAAETVLQADETIRATVVGAGTYTTTLSGSTIFYQPGIFPVKNVPVLRLSAADEAACLAGDEALLRDRVRWFLSQSDATRLILALTGPKDPDFRQLKALAGCIMRALDALLPPSEPILVVTEQDIAKALGLAMQAVPLIHRRIASIDGVRVEAGDFVDIGRPLMDGLVVPVVVKTLLFGQ